MRTHVREAFSYGIYASLNHNEYAVFRMKMLIVRKYASSLMILAYRNIIQGVSEEVNSSKNDSNLKPLSIWLIFFFN